MPYGLCAECRYAVKVQDPDDGEKLECRLNPPTSVTIVSDSSTIHHVGKFTTVLPDMGCWKHI